MQKSDVIEEFGSKIKYILNGGKCQIGVESTIINLTNKPTILRFGSLDALEIEKVLRKKILINTSSKKKSCTWSIPSSLFTWYSIKNKYKKTKKE